MLNVLISDDHSVVRRGIIMLLKDFKLDVTVFEAEDFDQTLQIVSKDKIDLLLLDIHIPGGDNMHMIEAIKIRNPTVRILIISSYDEKLYALQYMQAGADGYLQKDAEPPEISKAIQHILDGGKYVSKKMEKELLESLIHSKKNKSKNPLTLTARETEVMQLLSKGYSSKQIKEALNIQYSTISTYKEKIFEKMKVNNVVELAEKIRQMKAL